MVHPEYRSKKHPKPRDTFRRLRAEAEEPKAINTIQHWLNETDTGTAQADCFQPSTPLFPPPSSSSSTSSAKTPAHLSASIPQAGIALPLQPINGNQALLPPRTSLKRKVPNSFAVVGSRQSARTRKMAPPNPVDDGLGKMDEMVAMTGRGRRARKPTNKVEKGNASNVIGNTMEGEALSGPEGPNLDSGRPGTERVVPKRLFDEAAAKHNISISTPTSPSKKSGSPTKTSKAMNKRERMQFLEPRIVFRTLIAAKNEGNLSGKLRSLWLDHMNWNDQQIIPTKFKESMKKEWDTPNKTRPSIPDSCFGASSARYAKDDHAVLQLTISDVLSLADKYRHSGCTEGHWISIVVSPLLNLVRRLKCYQNENLKLAVVDLTAVEISPSSLCPISSDSLFKGLDKRIDAAIGLDLSSTKRDILVEGVYSEGSLPSINQTASFVNFVPMFTNVEVKRPNTDRDPLIQLGAWIGAEFTKRQVEGYSLDMPVLAIEIEGDMWNLHMVFAAEDPKSDTFQCNFVGPFEMGSTKSVLGIFQILDRLCRCADWGIGEYQAWFNEQVLSKYGYGG